MRVCFYDLAMPICIILGPLNWTRPDLIHIEGNRGWHQLRTREGAAAEVETPQSRPQVPAERPSAPPPKGFPQKGRPPGGRAAQAAVLGRGYSWGPGRPPA